MIGKPAARVEDARLLAGRGRFVDDVRLPGAAEMAVFRSPHAHARILSVDLSAARSAPGVLDAFCAEDLGFDLPRIPIRLAPVPGLERFRQRPLARGKVRYVGEPVAVVVAEDRYRAEDALALVAVAWETLPAVADAAAAADGGALLFEEAGSNVASAWTGARGDAEAAFRDAAYRRAETFRVRRQSPLPLETRGLVADFDPAVPSLRIVGATKVTYYNRGRLAAAFGLPEESVELVEVDVGGGFGARGELYPEDYLAPAASRRLGRPVKWIEDRREHLTASNHAREADCRLEIAATRAGDILGLRARIRGDLGAWARTNGAVALVRMPQFLPGPYRIKAFACEVEAVLTNKTPAGTYRGPGRFEANFFRERLIDMMAADLGLDPAEARMRNLLRPDELPFRLGELAPGDAAAAYDAGDYPAALARALEACGYESLRARQAETGPDGRRLGLGLACFVESSAGGPPETARVAAAPDGSVEVRIGASAMGQGLETAASQVCADVLGLGLPEVRVRYGTTSLLSSGGGTFHSRGAVMAGNAVRRAAEALRGKSLDLAALRWNAARDSLAFAGGAARNPETGDVLALAEIAALAPDGLAAEASFDNGGRTSFSYGAHAARVAVDPETGHVEVLRYVVVEDVGRILNPMLAEGQAVGGAAQGIGGALLDRLLFDEDGQPLATNLGEYTPPSATEVCRVDVVLTEDHPSTTNPMGFKGAGEGGIVAAGAAIGNAVAQALKGTGAEPRELPLDPASLRRQVSESGEGPG